MNLVSATYARNNFAKIIADVALKGKKYILLRESQPQAAIIPYSELLEKQKLWQQEFLRLITKAKPYFKSYFKRNKISVKNLKEKDFYELINQAAGRS